MTQSSIDRLKQEIQKVFIVNIDSGSSDHDKVAILFVCMGNICRSPAGEGILKDQVEKRQLSERFQIDSAGTIDYHVGRKADARMRAAASERGYKLTSIARQVHDTDLEEFDLLVAMDRENLQHLKRLAKKTSQPTLSEKLVLLSDFLSDEWPTDVPDPYYGGDDGFRYVLDMIEAACPSLIDASLRD